MVCEHCEKKKDDARVRDFHDAHTELEHIYDGSVLCDDCMDVILDEMNEES